MIQQRSSLGLLVCPEYPTKASFSNLQATQFSATNSLCQNTTKGTYHRLNRYRFIELLIISLAKGQSNSVNHSTSPWDLYKGAYLMGGGVKNCCGIL